MGSYIKENLFYFDCEWVPVSETTGMLEVEHPALYDIFIHQLEKWEAKTEKKLSEQEWWQEKAHMYPEFCEIITVSYGYFYEGEFVVKSIYGDDEKKIMENINSILDKVSVAGYTLCGYAIKRFDMPWLAKRMMAHGIKPHNSISLYGKKPWDIKVFDLPEVWGQGCMGESYTPFELACVALGIESSKDDISGSKVKEVYYNGEIERIKDYCEKDVTKTMELATKLIELMP